MQANVQTFEGKAIISLNGRFDFHAHREFKDACEAPLKLPEVKALEIDFGDVAYLDSSALGMLLMLKDKTQAANKALYLVNCHGTVRQVLEIANFTKIFNVK